MLHTFPIFLHQSRAMRHEEMLVPCLWWLPTPKSKSGSSLCVSFDRIDSRERHSSPINPELRHRPLVWLDHLAYVFVTDSASFWYTLDTLYLHATSSAVWGRITSRGAFRGPDGRHKCWIQDGIEDQEDDKKRLSDLWYTKQKSIDAPLKPSTRSQNPSLKQADLLEWNYNVPIQGGTLAEWKIHRTALQLLGNEHVQDDGHRKKMDEEEGISW